MTPVRNRWQGQCAFVIAPGPSLTQADVDAVRGRGRVIVLNCVVYMAPWADVLFSVDRFFWEDEAPTKDQFPGERWTFGGCLYGGRKPLAQRPGDLYYWDNYVKEPSVSPGCMTIVGATGGAGISLAFLFGCSPIVLLGYDMQATAGRTHCHPDHPRMNPDAARFERWRGDMALYANELKRAGGRVYNCSRTTALEGFPRRRLEEVLAE